MHIVIKNINIITLLCLIVYTPTASAMSKSKHNQRQHKIAMIAQKRESRNRKKLIVQALLFTTIVSSIHVWYWIENNNEKNSVHKKSNEPNHPRALIDPSFQTHQQTISNPHQSKVLQQKDINKKNSPTFSDHHRSFR